MGEECVAELSSENDAAGPAQLQSAGIFYSVP